MNSGDNRQVVHGLALASAVSQFGCVTIVVVIGALMVGLGMDKVFETRPLFTILLLLGSIPVSLYLLVRLALSTAERLAPPPCEASRRDKAAKDTSSDEGQSFEEEQTL